MTQNYNCSTSVGVLRKFLFPPLDPYYTTILRVILSISVFVVFWKISIPLSFIRNSPSLSGLYTNVFFTLPYSIAAVIVLILFCVGGQAANFGFAALRAIAPFDFCGGVSQKQTGHHVLDTGFLPDSELLSI